MRSGFFIALFVFCAGVPWAQQPTADSASKTAYVPSLTFDVAVIRESKPGNSFTVRGTNPVHNSRVSLTNFAVWNFLMEAFGVDRNQIVGLPDWTRWALFNVDAKSDDSVDERLAKLSDEQAEMEKQHMFQALLADRLQLKVHWETRKGPIYELFVAKNGPKLHPGGSEPPTAEELRSWGDRKIPAIYQRGSGIAGFELVGHQCSIDSLAGMLTGQMGAPVVDKTGLTGTYDFVLKYRGRTLDDASDDPSVPPPLMEAVADQLGLKLQPAKGQKQFLVVDHIERPSAN